MSAQQSLEQNRAAKAWENVEEIVDAKMDGEVKKKYSSLARKAPADIQINGLAQTLSFWAAKATPKKDGKKTSENIAHEKILEHASAWASSPDGVNLGEGNFLIWLIKEAKTPEYRRATSETIAFLIWVKRFAESKLPQE